MTEDNWSIKGKAEILYDSAIRVKNIQGAVFEWAYHVKDIETLRKKLIEDINNRVFFVFNSDLSINTNESVARLKDLINKRFGHDN